MIHSLKNNSRTKTRSRRRSSTAPLQPIEIAARAAVACWRGKEGEFSREIRSTERLTHPRMGAWLSQWMLSRSVPLGRRQRLLDFLNANALPRLRSLPAAKNIHFEVIEDLSHQAVLEQVLDGRPTSLISKLALSMQPSSFIPYDSRVRQALKKFNHRVKPHAYRLYMEAVLSHRPALRVALKGSGFSAKTLGAAPLMTQSLFELRTLDKWLMLEGGFSAERMARDFQGTDTG